jgi:hypothetical protein
MDPISIASFSDEPKIFIALRTLIVSHYNLPLQKTPNAKTTSEISNIEFRITRMN